MGRVEADAAEGDERPTLVLDPAQLREIYDSFTEVEAMPQTADPKPSLFGAIQARVDEMIAELLERRIEHGDT